MNTPVLDFNKTCAFFSRVRLEITIRNLKDLLRKLPEDFPDRKTFEELVDRLQLAFEGDPSEAFIVAQDAEKYGQSVLGAMIFLGEDDRVDKLNLALIGNNLVSMHSSGVDYM